MTPDASVVCSDTHALDDESLGWVRALTGTGDDHEDALERLHELLLRAAKHEIARRHAASGDCANDFEDLAVQAADDALVAITSKLHTYRGDSRFTTWAYKFALLEASVALRRRNWRARELPMEPEGLRKLEDPGLSPNRQLESSELMGAVRGAILEVLTAQQRAVLVGLVLNQVPIDVLAERRGTTRGALYKTLHDARRTLRAELAKNGLSPDSR